MPLTVGDLRVQLQQYLRQQSKGIATSSLAEMARQLTNLGQVTLALVAPHVMTLDLNRDSCLDLAEAVNQPIFCFCFPRFRLSSLSERQHASSSALKPPLCSKDERTSSLTHILAKRLATCGRLVLKGNSAFVTFVKPRRLACLYESSDSSTIVGSHLCTSKGHGCAVAQTPRTATKRHVDLLYFYLPTLFVF